MLASLLSFVAMCFQNAAALVIVAWTSGLLLFLLAVSNTNAFCWWKISTLFFEWGSCCAVPLRQ